MPPSVDMNKTKSCDTSTQQDKLAHREAKDQSINVTMSLPAATKYGACELEPAPLSGKTVHLAHMVEPKPTLLDRMASKIPCLGIIFALCASVFLGSAGMLVKMTTSVHGIQVAFIRAIIQILVYAIMIKLKNLNIFPTTGEWKAVGGRATFGAISITFSYCALKMIPLGDATTLRFSMPIWTLLISYLVLNESCSLVKVLAVFMSIVGVVIIAKPEECEQLYHMILHSLGLESDLLYELDLHAFEEFRAREEAKVQFVHTQLQGCLMALTSSVCLSLSLISMRLCKQTPVEITVLWLSIMSAVVCGFTLVSLNEWRLPDNWLDVLYILLNGICGSLGQWFITSALKIEQPGVISLARTCDIQVAFLYSAFLLHETIRVTSVIGSILVSCGVVSIVLSKWMGRPQAG